ncbi:hypothetical protein D3C71_1429360 [compost metagenome]
MLAARDRNRGQLVQLGVAVDVIGDDGLFQPARLKLFKLGQDALGVFQVPAHIAFQHQIRVVADDFANGLHRFQVFDHALLQMRGPVAKTHLERGKALVQIGLRFVLHGFQVGAVQLGVVDGNLLLGASAEQLENGLAHRLAQDVPDSQVHAGNRRHGHALAAPRMRGAVHALPQVFVVPGVLAHYQGRQVLVDDGLGHARGQGHIAQPDDAVVRFHFDHGPAVKAERAHGFLA